VAACVDLLHYRAAVVPSTRDFAKAVERVRARGQTSNDASVADELGWTLSTAALIALGQQAEAEGLVKTTYSDHDERRYERT
jgi:hypothetical protein